MFSATPPKAEDLIAHYDAGESCLLWRKLIADTETTVSAMMKLQSADEPCFLLESVEGGEVRGRYSIIGIKPDIMWRCRASKAEICRDVKAGNFSACDAPSMQALAALQAESQLDIPEGLPPMSAGIIGYMGYDMIKQVEDLPSANDDPIDIPDACLMRPSITLIFDARDGVMYITAPLWHNDKIQGVDAFKNANDAIDATIATLNNPIDTSYHHNPDALPETLDFQPNMSRDDFHNMVKTAQDYILAGDIFQVVPSQRFSAKFDASPLALYRALRYMNPSPFLFYLSMEGFALVGSSPEILVRVRDEKITVRPLAGTRKRGATAEEDAALEAELLGDPKELAEHLMLLDLGRNDVGRCAKTGSVSVTERMKVEHYSHVMHIVSNVEGTLDREKYGVLEALMSGFPAGTVSGAPKIRAMEIIDELEPHKRSFYAGCVGYFSAGGELDTCITLRTGLIKDGMLHVQAGAGVVADSDPEAEYQEACNKAKALMKAAEIATQFS